MYLEELLGLIIIPLLLEVVFVYVWIVEPALECHGFNPRGVGNWLVHRDWRLYYRECKGSRSIYLMLCWSYVLMLAGVATLFTQAILFGDVKLWD